MVRSQDGMSVKEWRVLPREDEDYILSACNTLDACFDMLNERRRLTLLKVGNEPFGFVVTVGWAADPNTVAAHDDEVRRGHV